jgi:hypothetical protein
VRLPALRPATTIRPSAARANCWLLGIGTSASVEKAPEPSGARSTRIPPPAGAPTKTSSASNARLVEKKLAAAPVVTCLVVGVVAPGSSSASTSVPPGRETRACRRPSPSKSTSRVVWKSNPEAGSIATRVHAPVAPRRTSTVASRSPSAHAPSRVPAEKARTLQLLADGSIGVGEDQPAAAVPGTASAEAQTSPTAPPARVNMRGA